MTAELPHEWLALLALAFALGLKHGLDADHLVAIDGLARYNRSVRPRLARWCGALFSLGHGALVTGAAAALGVAAGGWVVPGWLEDLGAWIAIVLLIAIGLANLVTVLRADPARVVRPAALRGTLLGRLFATSHPAAIVAVGALFAVSFDTLSQAALFAVAGSEQGGWPYAAGLGLAFTAGMLLTDGANGLWIAALLGSADARARVVSRVLGLAVAALSLAVAAYMLAGRGLPALAAWGEDRELALSAAVFVGLLGAFGLGCLLARRPAGTADPRRCG
jgi:high-affinity nickel-transport protein